MNREHGKTDDWTIEEMEQKYPVMNDAWWTSMARQYGKSLRTPAVLKRFETVLDDIDISHRQKESGRVSSHYCDCLGSPHVIRMA